MEQPEAVVAEVLLELEVLGYSTLEVGMVVQEHHLLFPALL
jgi:hypothetical protein